MAYLHLSPWGSLVSVLVEDMSVLGQLTAIRSTTFRECRVLLLNLFGRSRAKKKKPSTIIIIVIIITTTITINNDMSALHHNLPPAPPC